MSRRGGRPTAIPRVREAFGIVLQLFKPLVITRRTGKSRTVKSGVEINGEEREEKTFLGEKKERKKEREKYNTVVSKSDK